MRFLHKSKTYRLLKKTNDFSLGSKVYLIPVAGLIFGAALVGLVMFFGNRENLRPSSSHVVFVFDNGKKTTANTKAQTVGELVGRLNLGLIKQDVIEPTANTPIVEDNFRVNIYRARPVTVIVGGEKSVILTGQRSARVIAESAGLNIYPEDLAVFAPGRISEGELGEVVRVERSKPAFLNLYGNALTLRTRASTVAGLLAEKNITLSNGDSVKPSLSTKLSASTQVFVLRKGTKIETVTKIIPAPTQVVIDPSLTFGVTVVRQPGKPGKRLITYAVQTKNGKKVKTQIQAALVQEPVTQIIARGSNVDIPTNKTEIMARAGLNPSDYAYANYIISRESGWCYTKWQGEYGTCPAYHGAPSYGGYGLCQATPPGKMVSAGSDWAWNPVTQMKWCHGYAQGRYGSWSAAYNFWLSSHWW